MPNVLLDTVTGWFYKPRWKKHALLLDKGAKRFVNYKRDLLTPEQIAEVNSRRNDLQRAIRSKDIEETKEAGKRLEVACADALKRPARTNPLAENVEVFFVAIVIALGIRTYYLQPFRIPTGSMQPSLNGIQGEILDKKDWPNIIQRTAQIATKGRTYLHEVADEDLELISPYVDEFLEEKTHLNFFTFTTIKFKGGKSISVNAPANLLLRELGFMQKFAIGQEIGRNGRPVRRARITTIDKGATIVSGYSQSGDLVLVDKVSYHFRRPDRGETFVFDTRGNRGVHAHSGPQGAGSHYIKRLAGVPGDSLTIGGQTGGDGKLYIDGKVAEGDGFEKVMSQKPPYDENPGYVLAATPTYGGGRTQMYKPGDTLTLKDEKAEPLMREYAALGDNTGDSLDSRYWGTVKEYNLVGPALFSLWPITTGHWGFIE